MPDRFLTVLKDRCDSRINRHKQKCCKIEGKKETKLYSYVKVRQKESSGDKGEQQR